MSVATLRRPVPPHLASTSCRECQALRACIPGRLTPAELSLLRSLIVRRPPLRRHEPVFHAGQPVHYVYLIRTGSVKTYSPAHDGGEHVMGFHLAGEVLGLDGLACGRYRCSARALEATGVCALPVSPILDGGGAAPATAEHMLRLLSQELGRQQELLMLLGHKSADQRLASFLLGLAERYARQGQSSTRFSLTMSRRDIADYLGLAMETVSRLFTRFHLEGLLTVHGKRVELHAPALLGEVARGSETIVAGGPAASCVPSDPGVSTALHATPTYRA